MPETGRDKQRRLYVTVAETVQVLPAPLSRRSGARERSKIYELREKPAACF